VEFSTAERTGCSPSRTATAQYLPDGLAGARGFVGATAASGETAVRLNAKG
jgi:hypothetical protein